MLKSADTNNTSVWCITKASEKYKSTMLYFGKYKEPVESSSQKTGFYWYSASDFPKDSPDRFF